jgi:hypothetical protein
MVNINNVLKVKQVIVWRDMAKSLMALVILFSSHTLLAQTGLANSRESVTAPASLKYKDPSLFKRFFLGRNYRAEWETPVTFPVFRIKETGLKIEELGGGQQTKSLQLEDAQGREWALRTVDKDVEKALPKFLRHTLAQKVTQDMVSAAHPYAPLTIPTLAKAIGVVVPEPTFYYVPDDPALEPYRSLFAGTICMLEQKEPTPDRSKTENTEELLAELLQENDHLVIQQAVLRARLLDMLVADWDRHADQWRWGKRDSGSVQYFYAIPRDRDQAYFYSKGLLVKIARFVALRHLVGFQDDLDKLKSLNYKSWQFDRVFLNELDRREWQTVIQSVQSSLTDEVIHTAVSRMPPSVYSISGPTIESKLKARRNELLEAGLKYYSYLSRYATVNGTNDPEYFKISGTSDGLLVQVYDQKGGQPGRKIYERVFRPSETRQLTLQGYKGNDVFQVDENARSVIKLEIFGGEGGDVYTIKGPLKNTIYDQESEQNKIHKGADTRVRKDKHRGEAAK